MGKRSIAPSADRAENTGDPADTESIEDTPNEDAMDRTDLVALASPPCHECGASVQRVETRWHLDEDCKWRPGPYFMVCADGHRVLVEPLV
jgi:hypothetical protein